MARSKCGDSEVIKSMQRVPGEMKRMESFWEGARNKVFRENTEEETEGRTIDIFFLGGEVLILILD